MEQEHNGAMDHAATWYLKYFKGVVVVVMTFVLIALLVFLGLAGMSFMQKPVAPTAERAAPEKQVDFSEFVKYLLEREKQKKQEDDRQKRGDNVQFVSSSAAAPTVKYLEHATQFYRCTEKFHKMSSEQVPVVPTEEINKRIEQYRQNIEANIDKPYLGEIWLVDFLKFSCSILENPELIALKKEGKFTSLPIFAFHSSTFAAIRKEKLQFEDREKQRILVETAAEEARVLAERVRGSFFLSVAGASFSALFALAVFLILSRIESNLADIGQSLRHLRAGGPVS